MVKLARVVYLANTRGVAVSDAGGVFHVLHPPPGTVWADKASEKVSVVLPPVSDPKDVPSAAVIGISVVEPV